MSNREYQAARPLLHCSRYLETASISLGAALWLVFLSLWLWPVPAHADAVQKAAAPVEAAPAGLGRQGESSRYVQIPVLYMTDRGNARRYYGGYRMNEEGHVYRLPCGTLDYTLENFRRDEAFPAGLGWRAGSKPGRVPFALHPLATENEDDVYDKFGQAVAEAAKNSKGNEIFVYLHGFNNSFALAAARAARLAYSVKCPVVLYSWPSTAKFLQYGVDCGNNEWSQEHFNRLSEELLRIKEKTGVKINLVAHSMGNRLAVRSAPVTAGKHLFAQVFLVDPDMDAETFVHYCLRYLHGRQPDQVAKIRILFSRKDKALPMAQLLFGGYTRLGQGADTLFESLIDPMHLPERLQDTADMLGKLNPLAKGSTGPAAEEARERLHDRFEWIDFTIIDHGLFGHSIPFDLIASLWATGKPGPGLAIVEAQAGQVNGFTRWVANSFKQTQHIGDWGKCQRLVRVKDDPAAQRPDKN